METLLQNVADTIVSQVEKIQTSLYDLIATLHTELGSKEDNIVTATIMHILNTHRVTCIGALRGYRLVCNDGAHSTQNMPREYDRSSHFESYIHHCERPWHRTAL